MGVVTVGVEVIVVVAVVVALLGAGVVAAPHVDAVVVAFADMVAYCEYDAAVALVSGAPYCPKARE